MAAGAPTHPTLTSPAGNFCSFDRFLRPTSRRFTIRRTNTEATMNGLIYLVGLVVVVLFILSFLGLR
jgi:hypothetical protein